MSRRTVLLLVVLIVAAAIFLLVRQRRYDAQMQRLEHRAWIVVYPRGEGCAPAVGPWRFRAPRGHRATWVVLNVCPAWRESQTITVDNFRLGGKPNDPLVDDTPLRGEVRKRVRDDAELGVYKYDILIDGQVALDPEFESCPFYPCP